MSVAAGGPDSALHLHHGRPLRVFHGTYEIAGQGMMLARALRENGCESDALAYRIDWDGRRPDLVVDLDRQPGAPGRLAAMTGAFLRWGLAYDIYHLHFGTSFLPRGIDVPLLRRLGKRIVFHFHGCEVRNRAHMMATHRLATCTECDPFCRPPHQRRLLERAAREADLVLYSTLDLAESVPMGRQFPLAIETDRWEQAALAAPLPEPDQRDGVNGPVVVAHAPTNRLIKGTRHVEEAVQALRAELPLIELRMIARVPWAEMPAQLAGCDILVDQLMMGSYGLLAMEGMAERKAVVAYLRPDLHPLLGDCPVVSAEPATLAGVLRDLARDPARRRQLGEAGPGYVRARHDTRIVGRQLLELYREILDHRPPHAPQEMRHDTVPQTPPTRRETREGGPE
jgi:glycosyltransferase involved in cell wall biosynthesis